MNARVGVTTFGGLGAFGKVDNTVVFGASFGGRCVVYRDLPYEGRGLVVYLYTRQVRLFRLEATSPKIPSDPTLASS